MTGESDQDRDTADNARTLERFVEYRRTRDRALRAMSAIKIRVRHIVE